VRLRPPFCSISTALFVAMTIARGAAAQQQCPANGAGPLPLKYAGGPTVAAITACDLMTRLYQFADDSFLGRAIGTDAHTRATAYIEREVRRLGLKPAGDSGTFFQRVPVISRSLDTASTLTIGGTVYHAGTDFVFQTSGKVAQLIGIQVISGGEVYDTMRTPTPETVRGKVLLIRNRMTPLPNTFPQTAGYQSWRQTLAAAAAVVSYGPVGIPAAQLKSALTPGPAMIPPTVERQIAFLVTAALADAMMGKAAVTAEPGALGVTLTTSLRLTEVDLPSRNVIAIWPGSDPALRNEYVVIGSHSDHLSPLNPREHDSLRVFNMVMRPEGAESPLRTPSADEWTRILKLRDSVRAIRPARIDSIYNGANDGGSGSVAALEIAEAFAAGKLSSKRSILFIWHAGQETADWGSGYFVRHPTVPLDSLVAELNLNSIGRGSASDETGKSASGGPLHGSDNYLQVVGASRLSSELGAIVTQVNHDSTLALDYSQDAPGHPAKLSCRDDRPEYEGHGVPAILFTTGAYVDFHQLTDEPEYIQYEHLARVTRFAFQLARTLADLDHRPALSVAKPDHFVCQQ
jgi:hypothetical protein